jgi:uncharacterized protein with von Willebrand factor type A (vWA) domain
MKAALDEYQQFADGALSSADQALKRHKAEYESVKQGLTQALKEKLQTQFDAYEKEANSTTGAASEAARNHAGQVYNAMEIIRAALGQAMATWIQYQAVAGGGLIQQPRDRPPRRHTRVSARHGGRPPRPARRQRRAPPSPRTPTPPRPRRKPKPLTQRRASMPPGQPRLTPRPH